VGVQRTEGYLPFLSRTAAGATNDIKGVINVGNALVDEKERSDGTSFAPSTFHHLALNGVNRFPAL